MFDLYKILVSQATIRDVEQVRRMVEHVFNGGDWTREALDKYAQENNCRPAPLIQISEFPDGVQMIQDGHHRTISTIIAGKQFLKDEEVEVTSWTYEAYTQIDFTDWKWVTPFDPRTHNRVADFMEFKVTALKMAETDGHEKATEYIMMNEHLYRCPKKSVTVLDLAGQFNLEFWPLAPDRLTV